MTTYAKIRNATGAVAEYLQEADDWSAPSPKFGPDAEFRFVRVVDLPLPEHDAATQMVVPAEPELTATELRRGWTVVPKPVPDEVATWALREVCAQSTLRAPNLKLVIDGAIASLPEPAKSMAAGRWNSKPVIRRNDALTLQLIAGLGLTEAEADALFLAAANLN